MILTGGLGYGGGLAARGFGAWVGGVTPTPPGTEFLRAAGPMPKRKTPKRVKFLRTRREREEELLWFNK